MEPLHGIEHVRRTAKFAEYLARKEKADVQIARLGALLHQIHDKNLVEKLLREINIDEEIIQKLVHCVECCEVESIENATTIEAKVVYDADKLQVIGPFGIIREIICDVLPPRNRSFYEALKHTKMIEQKCYDTLQTETARELAKEPHRLIRKFWEILDKWNKVDLY